MKLLLSHTMLVKLLRFLWTDWMAWSWLARRTENAKTALALLAASVSICSAHCQAQIDSFELSNQSLSHILETSKSESNSGRYASAALLAEYAKHLAQEQDYRDTLAWAYFHLGNAFFGKRNFVSARTNYEGAIEGADLLDDSFLLSQALSRYGVLMLFQEKYYDGDLSLNQALAIADSIRDTTTLRDCFEHLGVSAYLQDKPQQALEYQFKALELGETQNNETWIASAAQNIGLVYADLEEWTNAENFTNRALDLRIKLVDDRYVAACLKNLCHIYLDSGVIEPAEQTYHRYVDRTNKAKLEVTADDRAFFERYVERLNELKAARQKTTNNLIILIGVALLLMLSALLFWKDRRIRTLLNSNSKRHLEQQIAREALEPRDSERADSIRLALAPIFTRNEGKHLKCYVMDFFEFRQTEIGEVIGHKRSTVSKLLDQSRNLLGSNDLKAHAIKIGIDKLSPLELENIFGIWLTDVLKEHGKLPAPPRI